MAKLIRRIFNSVLCRLAFAVTLSGKVLWWKPVLLLWSIYSAFALIRDDFWMPSDVKKYRGINMIPRISLHAWVICTLIAVMACLFEASYRHARALELRLKSLEQEPDDRIPIWKAIQQIDEHCTQEPLGGKYLERARIEMRQAAADGRIKLWGCKYLGEKPNIQSLYDSIREEIPKEFWLDNKLSPVTASEPINRNIANTIRNSGGLDWEGTYADLAVSARKVNAIWPEGRP
jgi:hypothetical protein